MNEKTLILASASPRRRELMAMTGLPFTVDAPDVDESCARAPREAVMELSRRKAAAAAALHPGCVVLAADTLVSVDDVALGKPRDEADAFRMLRALSGRWHQVYTGVTVVDTDGTMHCEAEGTDVHFEEMTDGDIRRYIATGEPMDKAGAYGIQERACLFAESFEGDFFNIIGLPVEKLYSPLKTLGILPDWQKHTC